MILQGLGQREEIGGVGYWHGIAVEVLYALFPTVEAATASFQESEASAGINIVAENLGIGDESYRLPNIVHFRMGNVRVFVNVIDPKFGDPEVYAKIAANKMVSTFAAPAAPTKPFRIDDISLTRASVPQLVLNNNSGESIFIYKIRMQTEYYWPRPGSPGSPTTRGSSEVNWSTPQEVKPGQTFRFPDDPQDYVNIEWAIFYFQDSSGQPYQVKYNIGS